MVVRQVIGPAGGTVNYPGGAALTVAPNTFDHEVTVTMRQVPDSDLPVSNKVDLVNGTGYDLSMTDVNGTDLTEVPSRVQLSVPVPAAQRRHAVLYWIDDGSLQQVGSTKVDDHGIVSDLPHMSRYVAGVPVDDAPSLGFLPWAVAAAASISGLLILLMLVLQVRRSPRRRRAW